MKQREYRDFLLDIANSIDDVESFIGEMTYEDFLEDKKTSHAVVRSLEIIGEATKNIPMSVQENL